MLLLLTKMLEKEEKNLNGYCIDGYPRTEEQLDQFKQKVRVSISLISSRRFKFFSSNVCRQFTIGMFQAFS